MHLNDNSLFCVLVDLDIRYSPNSELGLHLMHASHPLLKDDYPHYPSLSYPLSAVTTDNGSIFDVLVMIGLKSMLSCLVGARLILIVHMICCNTSAPTDNFAYFLLVAVRSV